ncbi:metallophosphoesterase [Lentibacillus halophilus]|uniref:Metallophosphoesterase n=1 Tax=Lentibacillus halophilus TaxID=295065 RepID=A0ABP3JB59_9BACI
MKKRLVAVMTFIVGLIAVFTNIYRDTYVFKCKKNTFQSPKLPTNMSLTILQISDLHNHVFGANNERLLSAVTAAQADILVLTGDLIDRKTQSFNQVFYLIERLTASHSHVYFITGNHEIGNSQTSAFLHGLHRRHVTILNNRNATITINGLTINLAGVADASSGYDHPEAAFRALDTDDFTILLSHTPEIVELYAPESIPADLILSGHTHGGQVRLPLIGAILSADHTLFPKLVKGTYLLGPDRYLYIDSGLGTTRLPIRFLNQSQFSLLTITGK